MLGNTLVRWGTEAQKRRYILRRILSGEDVWCQGFSEPDAGSDLAGADAAGRPGRGRVGDQRPEDLDVAGRRANWIFVLARTDPTAPRHRGITFLLVPARSRPGSRSGRSGCSPGGSEFSEVFFTDARTPAANVVGGGQRGLGGGHDPARPRAGRGGGDQPDPVPGRAGPAPRAGAGARAVAGPGRSASGWPVLHQGRDHAVPRVPDPHRGSWPAGEPRPRGLDRPSSTGASTTSSPPTWPSAILGADALAPEGRRPLPHFRADEPGRPQHRATRGSACSAERPVGDDLRRDLPDPAQHHRREPSSACPRNRRPPSGPAPDRPAMVT